MKKILKNTILQKTIISILVITLCINFMFPTVVSARDIGGVLFEPIQKLLLNLADTFMYVVNMCSGMPVNPIIELYEGWDWLTAALIGSDNLLIDLLTSATIGPVKAVAGFLNWLNIGDLQYPTNLEIPVFVVSPDKIFSNKVPLLDVNIINPSKNSAALDLQGAISSWYNAFRNLAIVGLLSILVYIAIRIIMSSTASDKSKYKQMFTDWLVAFCLLFFMHYIMSFSITMVDIFSDSLSSLNNKYIRLPITYEKLIEEYGGGEKKQQQLAALSDEEGYIKTDLMGYVRFIAQTNVLKTTEGYEITAAEGAPRMACTIMYLTLVIYTVMFLIIYIKRLVYICFLTVISPLVALTYPIDKINDGKAQGFNGWFREYIFNLLIQPLHLILYTMLLGTATELATKYLIYPLVVLGFMLQSEKIMRKLFNFEKSDTAPSVASGALGGAMIMKGIDALKSGGKKIAKGAGGAALGAAGGDKIPNFIKDRKSDSGMDASDLINSYDKEKITDASSIETEKSLNEKYGDLALEKYKNDGYGTNEDGNYFNPYDSKWDENYNPREDEKLLEFVKEEEQEKLLKQQEEEEEKAKEEALRLQKEEEARQLELDNEKPNYFKGATTLIGSYVKDNAGTIGKGIVKGIGMGVGAATLGTVGIAAGLASDDFSNVFTYGAAGVAAGAGVGGGIGKKAVELPSSAYRKTKEMQDKLKEASYSNAAYERIKNKELDEAFMRNKEMQKLYQNKFKGTTNGKDNWKIAMEAALKYRKHGITDNDTIIKAMKAKSKFISNDNLADDKRIYTAKLAMQAKTEKEIETVQNRLREKKINEEQIKDQANMLRQINDLTIFN